MKRDFRRHEKWLKKQGRGMVAAKRIFATAAMLLVIGFTLQLALVVPLAQADGPTIVSVTPDHGNSGEALGFTITGSGFTGASSISFGSGITVTSFSVNTDSEILGNIAIASYTTCGSRNVSVMVGNIIGSKTNGFTVLSPPVVSSIWPNTGDQGHTISPVVISGACFIGEMGEIQVVFLDPNTGLLDPKIHVSFPPPVNSSMITASISIDADAALGKRHVRVTTPGGSGILPYGFTVEPPPPIINSVSPNSVYRGQTTYVNIYGRYFTGVSAVSFGSGITVLQFGAFSDTWIIAKVSVLATATPGLRDVSVTTLGGGGTLPGSFSVPAEEPMIKVLSPNSGTEKWEIGTEQSITWSSSSGLTGKVKIELSTNGGSNWKTLFSATQNDGIETCKVTNGPSNRALVRVSTITYPQVSDTSDMMFALTLPTITVLSPNGAEKWEIGSEQTITWKSSPGVSGSKVKIELSSDSGKKWTTIKSFTLNDGTETWKVKVSGDKPTNQAMIRVISQSMKDVWDTSDVFFILTLPTIKVMSPNGGENWTIGTYQTIEWTSSPGLTGKVRIQLSTDGGKKWKTITSSTTNDGTEKWRVTGNPTNQAFIKVLSSSNKAIFDFNDASFSIR